MDYADYADQLDALERRQQLAQMLAGTAMQSPQPVGGVMPSSSPLSGVLQLAGTALAGYLGRRARGAESTLKERQGSDISEALEAYRGATDPAARASALGSLESQALAPADLARAQIAQAMAPPEITTVDQGNQIALMDKRTGKVYGTLPKGAAPTRPTTRTVDRGNEVDLIDSAGRVISRYSKAAAPGAGASRVPMGYEPDPAKPGSLRPIPGGPADKTTSAQAALGDPSLTGDAFLSTVPDVGLQQLIKAIAEGREQVPRIYRSSKAGEIGPTEIAAAVSQYDPTFNAQDYNSRNRMRIDATSGRMAKNMLALNQATVHLGQLATQVGGTAGHAIPFIGGLVNRAENAVTDPYTGDVTKFKSTADAVGHEVRALFAGSSGGTLQELDRYLEQLNASNSTEQKRAAIQNIAQLVRSRIGLLQDQYAQGMGKAGEPFEVAFPHAQATLDMLAGLTGEGTPASPAPAAAATPPLDPAVAARVQHYLEAARGR